MLLQVLASISLFLNAMASDSAGPRQVSLGSLGTVSEITISGESYMPTPHEVNPELPVDYVWTQFPLNDQYMSDPHWYDALGQDPIVQRRIWAIATEQGQIDQFRQLLHERPDRGLDLMFAAAVKGKVYIIRFLLEQGVKATANEVEGDDGSLVPLHAAAYQGRFDCVKILMEEGKLGPNIIDDIGGTPLMRACWGKRTEIVRHLLEAGADINIRQQPVDDEPGTDAFQFACGSGCLECAELILAHAISLELEPTDLITRTAVAAAAASDNPDMLKFVLDHGGYPLPDDNGVFSEGVALTSAQKSALAYAFHMTLRQVAFKSIGPVYEYLNSTTSAGELNFPSLPDTTIDTLVEFLLGLSSGKDAVDQCLSAFTFVYNLLFSEGSRFTNPSTVGRKSLILGDAFYWAAQNGVLEVMKLIYSLYPEIDVDHLSREMQPVASTALYTAAGMGRVDVVQWLSNTFSGKLSFHQGVGKFVNGPTALWIAVSNGEREVVKVIVGQGGPIEQTLGEFSEPNEGNVIFSSAKAFRSPVIMWSEEAWKAQHGDLSKRGQGETIDKDGNEMKYLVLELREKDWEWLSKSELRRSDEELLKSEKNGRELKPKDSERGS